MTKDEIINELESKGIVLMIGDSYHITEKYKKFLNEGKPKDNVSPKKVVNLRILARNNVDNFPSSDYYPENVMEQTGTQRSIAFMEFCDIPIYGTGNSGSKYRLRSLDKVASTIISNIILNQEDFIPFKVVEVIKSYYANISMPKAFKTFVKEDLVEMYLEHIAGNTLEANIKSDDKNNSKWG
jgi:hypothetical protein